MCDCEATRSMDVKTPRNVYLSAFYKRSFAFYTVKNRMPIILTQLVDNLARNKIKIGEEYGEEAKEELKTVIGEISELKYEIQTNKPLKNLIGDSPDIQIYNDYIAKQAVQDGHPTHFHTIWLLTECYMYRRITQIFTETKSLKNYDPFRPQKEDAYVTALPIIYQMGQHILDIVNVPSDADKMEFMSLLKLNLWGNKCDLSISLGQVSEHATLFDTAALDKYILCDDSAKIWDAICDNNSSSDIVDIIFDNAGYEVFTDLCLADYIISKNLAVKVRLYVKTIPWFISDVTTHDFRWILQQLKEDTNPTLKILANRWSNYLQNEIWLIIENNFWTLPLEYKYMEKIDPALYKKIAQSKLAFFKGDLNYRKLFGEMNWDPATPVDVGLQNFHPTKLGILRTTKADIVCGLEEGLAEKIEVQDPKWLVEGKYGLIQFSDKIIQIE